mgnify:CR=1 FL=1
MAPVRFYVLGAPRSATHALRSYLAQHPEIAVSRSVETFDVWHRPPSEWTRWQRQRYAAEFGHVRAHHRAVGEIFPMGLFSPLAARHILDYDSSARAIV